jgi:hypothetical protein
VNKAALDCLVIESGNLQAYSAYREARPSRRLRALATRAETTMSHHLRLHASLIVRMHVCVLRPCRAAGVHVPHRGAQRV